MPWPTDPERRAQALERHRAAQRKRWEAPEARARARAANQAQYADPAQRALMSTRKRAYWQAHPEAREHLARIVSGKARARAARRAAIKAAAEKKRVSVLT